MDAGTEPDTPAAGWSVEVSDDVQEQQLLSQQLAERNTNQAASGLSQVPPEIFIFLIFWMCFSSSHVFLMSRVTPYVLYATL